MNTSATLVVAPPAVSGLTASRHAGLDLLHPAPQDTATLYERAVQNGAGVSIGACRVVDLARAVRDPGRHGILRAHDHLVADGPGPGTLARLAGLRIPEAATASPVDLLLWSAARHQWRVYFLGGRDQQVFEFAHMASQRYGRLRIAGAWTPGPTFDVRREADRLIDRVNGARADVLLSAPRTRHGEAFPLLHRDALDVSLTLTRFGGFWREPTSAGEWLDSVPGLLRLGWEALRTRREGCGDQIAADCAGT